jgi:deazaflavin-dependent oxidoreductase (nitroreductase family)
MLGAIVAILVIAILVITVLGVGFVLGMRAKSRLVRRVMIWFTRTIMNPRQMRSAGKPGAYAAVIRNRGRVSGREYQTPVGAVVSGDGFVIALPYGTQSNWVRNVLAAGSATLVHEGHTYTVDQPQLVPMAGVEGCFSETDQRAQSMMGVDLCLRLHRVEEVAAAPASLQPA